MLPIKIKNGVASINVNAERKLTPRQLATLKNTESVSLQARDKYLANLLGLTKEPVRINRPQVSKFTYDRLASKPKASVLERFKQLCYCGEDAEHKPSKRSVGEWIGVEIECLYPSECETNDDGDESWCPDEDEAHAAIRRAIERAGIPRASVKSDGSLHDGEGVGVEVTLLFNAVDGFEPLFKLCKVLNDQGCFVNKSCGLHVHLDCRHLKNKGVKLIGRRLGRALPLLKWIVDPSRHSNNYCKMEVSPLSSRHDDRYYAVNLTAFRRYQTIEIRMHGGSTNPKKIKNWIELLRFLGSTRVPKSFSTFQDLIDLGTPEHLVEYADKRITRLNPGAWDKLMPIASPLPSVSENIE